MLACVLFDRAQQHAVPRLSAAKASQPVSQPTMRCIRSRRTVSRVCSKQNITNTHSHRMGNAVSIAIHSVALSHCPNSVAFRHQRHSMLNILIRARVCDINRTTQYHIYITRHSTTHTHTRKAYTYILYYMLKTADPARSAIRSRSPTANAQANAAHTHMLCTTYFYTYI